MQLRTYKETPTRIPAKALKDLFDAIVAKEAKKSWKAEINLVFTDDRRIRKLNAEYRHKDKATDVLSFTVESPSVHRGVFGEIYISCETAARQAKEYGGTLSEEYLRLTCHGLLHLFGYDHKKKDEAVAMQNRERRYLDGVGGGSR
jgi:probable rRNA maturation factor